MSFVFIMYLNWLPEIGHCFQNNLNSWTELLLLLLLLLSLFNEQLEETRKCYAQDVMMWTISVKGFLSIYGQFQHYQVNTLQSLSVSHCGTVQVANGLRPI
jgi:hypothetical protein